MSYKWHPSKATASEFSEKMAEIEDFCIEHGISHSASMDSYYFTLHGESYRVSNHTIAASNAGRFGYDRTTGEWVARRERYHAAGEYDRTHEITAGKTRLIEIYTDLEAGIRLDKRGRRIKDVPSTADTLAALDKADARQAHDPDKAANQRRR